MHTNDIAPVILEIINGDARSFAQAAKLIPPTRGSREHADPSCVWRWATYGAKTPTGEVVKLETAKFGSRRLTSKAAIVRFIAKLTGKPEVASQEPVQKPNPSASRKAADAAKAKLIALGA